MVDRAFCRAYGVYLRLIFFYRVFIGFDTGCRGLDFGRAGKPGAERLRACGFRGLLGHVGLRLYQVLWGLWQKCASLGMPAFQK